MNVEILKLCRNYKEIVECEFLDDDVFSKKMVDFYKKFVSAVDLSNNESIMKIRSLDNALLKYMEDYKFAKRLRDTIDVSSVISDSFSYLNEFMDYIVIFSDEYENTKDNVVAQTKWI